MAVASVTTPTLVGLLGELSDEASFITQSATVRGVGPGRFFNGQKLTTVRHVRVCGHVLEWAQGTDLLDLQGEQIVDLGALEMHADHVIIREPLRFPGTTVTIHARTLEFRGRGSIDTTPLPFSDTAQSPFHTKDGHPADASLAPTYAAAAGANGQRGGDIHLYVSELEVANAAGTVFFTADGSPGQAGEAGGLKPYVAGPDMPPVKDLLGLKVPNLREMKASDWRWPDGGSAADMKLEHDALNQGHVVYWRTLAYDDNFLIRNVVAYCLTAGSEAGKGPELIHAWSAPQTSGNFMSKTTHEVESTVGHKLRPGNGEDAYPSGKPGTGGDGGNLTVHVAGLELPPGCWTLSGASGTPGKTIPGGAAGRPHPAYHLDVSIVSHSLIESSREPAKSLTDVSAKPGADAPGVAGAGGADGRLVVADGASEDAWCNGWMLDATLAYARDAFRNGHRDLALAALSPYVRLATAADTRSDPALLAGLDEAQAIARRLDQNLDYFGRVPGWLPRLNAQTAFELWTGERQSSSKILYFATRATAAFARIADLDASLHDATAALSGGIGAAQRRLPIARDALAAAQAELLGVADKVTSAEDAFKSLKDRILQQAKDQEKERRILEGVGKVVGGLLAVIPYGQPVLGAIGATVADLTRIAAVADDAGAGAGEALKSVGGRITSFLTENEKTLAADAGSDLRSRIDDATHEIASLAADTRKRQETRRRELAILEQQAGELQAQLTRAEKAQKDAEAAAKAAQAAVAAVPPGQADAHAVIEARALLGTKQQAVRDVEKEIAATDLSVKSKTADLNDDIANTKLDLERRNKKVGEVLAQLKRAGAGVAVIGSGIQKMAAAPDEAQVQSLMKKLIESEFHDEYSALVKRVDEVNALKLKAITKIVSLIQEIDDARLAIARGLVATSALADQRQNVGRTLDAGALRYVRSMASSARDRMAWYQYNFIQAHKYEVLEPPDAKFLNLDDWVVRLQKVRLAVDAAAAGESARQAAAAKGGTPAEVAQQRDAATAAYLQQHPVDSLVLSLEQFAELEATVVKDQILALASKVVAHRLSSSVPKQSDIPCALRPDQLQTLRATGSVTFNLVRDFGVGGFADVAAKIIDLKISAFVLETDEPTLELDIELRHSGRSVVYGGAGKPYYAFQIGPEDDPIGWGYTFQHGFGTSGDTLVADKAVQETDALLTAAKVTYREYLPALFGDITLWINRTQAATDEQEALRASTLARIKAITKVQLSVSVARGGR